MWKFDASHFLVFGIPSYIFFAVIGLVFALSLYPILLLIRNERADIYMPRALISLVFMIVGAKVLGIAVSVLNCIQNGVDITLDVLLQSGIVYYGGVFGLLFGMALLCKIKGKYIAPEVFDPIAVVIPLFHIFGRIGCFTSGCCYGKITDSKLAVLYTIHNGGKLETTLRIPTQIIEAAINIIIFFVILFFYIRRKHEGNLIYIYLAIYAVVRFFVEFIRGDTYRGMFIGISTSQIISLVVFVSIMVKTIKTKGYKNHG